MIITKVCDRVDQLNEELASANDGVAHGNEVIVDLQADIDRLNIENDELKMVNDSHVTMERVLCQKWEVADRKGILLQGALEAVKKFAENTQWYIKDILSVTTLSVVLHNAKMIIARVDIALGESDSSPKKPG